MHPGGTGTNVNQTNVNKSNFKQAPLNRTTVTLRLFAAGYCEHAEWITIRGGSRQKARFPAGYAVIGHPVHGQVLFDTGYARRFHEHTSAFPYSLYAKVTPAFIGEGDSAVRQLADAGIRPDDVRQIVVSHFHADHIAGLRDFPRARYICAEWAYEAVKPLKGLKAVLRGFVPSLLPGDFEERCRMLREDERVRLPGGFPFPDGYDLFGDGSVIAVDVSGHAEGQLGLFVRTERSEYFLCADAVWSSRAFREHLLPHPAAGLIMSGRSRYKTTFQAVVRLHRDYPQFRIIPSHCMETWERYIRGGEPL